MDDRNARKIEKTSGREGETRQGEEGEIGEDPEGEGGEKVERGGEEVEVEEDLLDFEGRGWWRRFSNTFSLYLVMRGQMHFRGMMLSV